MTVVARLSDGAGTRVGWAIAAAVAAALAVASLWSAASVSGRLLPRVVVVVLGWGYAWIATGALQLARGRRAYVAIHRGSLVITHDGLLSEPLVAHRDEIDEAEVDRRPAHDRRTAAARRAGGIVKPTFLDDALPVVSASPSAHGDGDGGVVPNLVLRFTHPLPLQGPASSVRLLLRLAQGRNGQYRGPRRGQQHTGVRLVVDDVTDIVRALDTWSPLDVERRDEAYLATITDAHRRRHRRQRLLMWGVAGAVAAVVVALEVLAGS